MRKQSKQVISNEQLERDAHRIVDLLDNLMLAPLGIDMETYYPGITGVGNAIRVILDSTAPGSIERIERLKTFMLARQ